MALFSVAKCSTSQEIPEPISFEDTTTPIQSGVESLKSETNWDNLGIVASAVCILHCLLTPFLVAVLPVLGLQFLEDDLTHKILASFVFFFALFAIVPGYLRHRSALILLGTVVGLSLVFFATFWSEGTLGAQWELPLISLGNILVVFSHYRNRKLCTCAQVK